jgi:hypothetical protein
MEKNEGMVDRSVRVVIGIAIIGLAVYLKNYWIAIIALLPLGTATMGYCPMYSLIGINTLGAKHAAARKKK